MKNALNPSTKLHLITGALVSFWSFIFIIIAKPFEHGQMDTEKWIIVGLGFSIVTFLAYLAVILYQNLIYTKREKWDLILEISTYFIFFLVYVLLTFVFYKSPMIRGFYSFFEFLSKLIFGIFLILTPIIFVCRRYITNVIPDEEEYIRIKGENKLDILQIKKTDLVCISNAQNYVEIFYLQQDKIKTKLIRTTLKKLQNDFKFLVQIHRSHLINPFHFKSWKDTNTILIHSIELPVSKSYKNHLFSL